VKPDESAGIVLTAADTAFAAVFYFELNTPLHSQPRKPETLLCDSLQFNQTIWGLSEAMMQQRDQFRLLIFDF
jgi:hypothetical protein